MDALLDHDDELDGLAVGILSRLFRKVLSELQITPMVWNKMMYTYLYDPRNRVPRHSRGRSSTRGNLNKELRKANMTWNNFEKGLRFLNPLSATFTVEIKWRSGKESKHSFAIGQEPGPEDPED
jgi:hypothetical protein